MNTKPLVVLIQACKHSVITDKYSERYPYPPVGLIYLSNMLTLNGYAVEIIDLYLAPLSRAEFIDTLRALPQSPLLIGISSYTDSIQEAYKIAEVAKETFTETPIIFGGAHVSFMYCESMEECPAMDYCCRGEGEALMVELLEHLRFGFPQRPDILGLVYRDGEMVMVNPQRGFVENMDILPFPYYTELMKSGMQKQEGLVFVSSRGCPGGCIFCASRALSGSKYRFHSAEWIISMLYYHDQTTLNIFGALDDSFTVNRSRLKKFVAYLEQLNIHKPWSCKSRVDVIDEELTELLRSSHCKSVHIGVESGDDEVLRTVEKHITLKQVFNAIRLLTSNNMRAECSFILGHPTDTLESMERTLILAAKLDQSGVVLSVAGICTPFPGTKIWNRIDEYPLKMHSYNWRIYDLSTPIFTTDNFSQDDLRRAYFYFHYQCKTGQELPGLTDCKHTEYIQQVDELVRSIQPKSQKEGA